MSRDPPDEATVNIDVDALEAAAPAGERDRAYLIVLAGERVGTMLKIEEAEMVLGRSSTASVRLGDDGISRLHAKIRQVDGYTIIEDMKSRNGTFVNGLPVVSQVLQDGDKIRIGSTTILKFTYQDNLDENFQQQLLTAAVQDTLTGAYNRRHLDERLDAEFKFAQRHTTGLALIIIDLDHFKRVNDTDGHLAGDSVLAEVGKRVAAELRHEDIFGRYGGEEFCVICRGVNHLQASVLAERLRVAIASTPVPFEGRGIAVTASFGVAAYPGVEAKEPGDLFKAADEALYEAKSAGRNTIRTRPAR